MPTRSSLNTQLQDIMRFYREFRDWGSNSGADDMDSMVRTFQGNLDSGWGGETEAAVDQWQSALAGMYDNAAPLLSHLRDWGVFLAVPNPNDAKAVCQALYRDAIDNTQRFLTRGFTRGTPTAGGSNVGSGVWRRITTDARSFAMEGSFGADVYTARCTLDASTPGGIRNGETFEVRSRNKAKWSFTPSGAGITTTITAVDPRNAGFLLNPSFDNRSGSNNAPTAITNWSSSVGVSASSYRFVSGTDNCFLPARTPTDVVRALSIRTSQTLAQRIDLGGGRFDPETPYNFAINFLSSASGTLRIRLGAVSASRTISAGTSNVWSTLEITGTYYRSFATSIIRASIVTQSLGGGSARVKVDDATLAPYKGIDGTWHLNRPGRTPWRAGSWVQSTGDTFTITDTATESVMQRHYARLTRSLGGPAGGGFYQPSTSAGGAGLVAEPS